MDTNPNPPTEAIAMEPAAPPIEKTPLCPVPRCKRARNGITCAECWKCIPKNLKRALFAEIREMERIGVFGKKATKGYMRALLAAVTAAFEARHVLEKEEGA